MYDALLVLGRLHGGRQLLPEASHPSDLICLTLPGLWPLPNVAWGSTIFRAMPFDRVGPFGFPAFGVRATGYLAVPMANRQRLRDLSEPCTYDREAF